RAQRLARVADAVGFVRLESVQGEAVFVSVDRDGPDAELVGGAKHSDGNFAPVRHEQLFNRSNRRGLGFRHSLLFHDAVKEALAPEEQLPAGEGGRGTDVLAEPIYGERLGHLITVTDDLRDAVAAGDVDSAGGADRRSVHVVDGIKPKGAAPVLTRL